MSTIRPKDTAAVGSPNESDVVLLDGPNGTRNMTIPNLRTHIAAKFVEAPTTFKLCELDVGNKIPAGRLPDSVVSGLVYDGTVAGNAVPDTLSAAGRYKIITSAGTSQSKTWAVGDMAIYKGTSGQYDQVSEGVTQLAQGGTGGTTAATARTNLEVLSAVQAVGRIGQARGGVIFDGVTTTARVTSVLTGQNIAANDFSAWVKLSVPASVSANHCLLSIMASSSGVNGANALLAFIGSDGSLTVRLNGGTTSDFRNANIAGFVSAYGGGEVDLVITRTGTTLVIYVNGLAVTFVESTNGTPPTWGGSITSTYCHIGLFDTFVWTGAIRKVALFNLGLAAADVLTVVTKGIPYKWRWGNLTKIIDGSTLNGGFETAGGGGADVFASWAEATAGTSAIVRDTADFDTGAASARLDIDASGNYAVLTQNVLEGGKAYRATFRGKISDAGGTNHFHVQPSGGVAALFTLTAAWATYTADILAVTSATLELNRDSNAASKSIWIDGFELMKLGAFVNLELDSGIGFQCQDATTNKRHAEINHASIAHAVSQDTGVIKAGPLTADGEVMAGALSALPSGSIIERIVARNTTANAITNFAVGTTAAGVDLVAAVAVGANATVNCTLANAVIAATANKEVHVSASAWNSGSVELTIYYRRIQ